METSPPKTQVSIFFLVQPPIALWFVIPFVLPLVTLLVMLFIFLIPLVIRMGPERSSTVISIEQHQHDGFPTTLLGMFRFWTVFWTVFWFEIATFTLVTLTTSRPEHTNSRNGSQPAQNPGEQV